MAIDVGEAVNLDTWIAISFLMIKLVLARSRQIRSLSLVRVGSVLDFTRIRFADSDLNHSGRSKREVIAR